MQLPMSLLAVLMCGFRWVVATIPWNSDRMGMGVQHRVDVRAWRHSLALPNASPPSSAGKQCAPRESIPAAASGCETGASDGLSEEVYRRARREGSIVKNWCLLYRRA